MKPVTRYDLRQIGDYLYEVPQSFRHDMRVSARFYADGEILDKALEDRSLEQLVNTATLPGVVEPALAMPDIHQGYGFPIGGVAATLVPQGIISPGGVGYDINCLCKTSLILHYFGYSRTIGEMASDWSTATLRCQDFAAEREACTSIVRYISRPPSTPVYRLTTEAGDEIMATADHPFWTPDGMVELGRLQPGDRVAVMPFLGVPFESSGNQVILDESDIELLLASHDKGTFGNALGQIVKHLKRRGLLPLRGDSPALPYLLKIAGFVFGDGHIHFAGGSGKGVTWFYGQPEDLAVIRRDVQAVGFTPSRVYRRERQHHIVTPYKEYDFACHESTFKVAGSAFATLLAALGVPVGNKAMQDFGLPTWMEHIPRWQQRLFLAALFGAELSAPRAFDEHGHNFYPPILAVNKWDGFVESGSLFLEGVARLLSQFGVITTKISTRREQTNQDGTVSYRLRLILSSTPDNLIRLWGQIGFEYNLRKSALASAVAQYLKHKVQVLQTRTEAGKAAVAMRIAGVPRSEIHLELAGVYTSTGFLEHSLYRDPDRAVCVGGQFATFEKYRHEATAGLGQSGMVWERIASIEPVNYDGDVYDFTVDHPDHNFVANGFVVSNCGVRLLGSHLDIEDVRPYIDRLADAMYRSVPSGMGTKGNLHLNQAELDEILAKGSKWAQQEGYARPEDVAHTEERGQMAGADPAKVSAQAKKRGMGQVGTLGSGNHFAELDVVTEIFDANTADVFGLRRGQIAVQVHCGSRGLGHQVATDYIQEYQKASKRFGYELPDRELVCAPLDSPEGQSYLAAMNCAANYAWANRQVLTYQLREAFAEVLGGRAPNWDLFLVYDVAHNMAKLETHWVEGREQRLCVHRKGATRAFGPGHPDVPADYRTVGQPVLVPGSMGTASYVLVGTAEAMRQTFGSCCHGAGRVMSRSAAKRAVRGQTLQQELERDGISIRAGSMAGLAEEAPQAYKDVERVVAVVEAAGIARIVARLEPLAVIKG